MGRPKKRFCVRGHDTQILGRCSNHRCYACAREDNRIWQRGHARRLRLANPDRPFENVPAAPLVPILLAAALQLRSATEHDRGLRALSRQYAKRYGTSWVAAEKQLGEIVTGRRQRVNEATADQWLVLEGADLNTVYPELVWDVSA